VNAGIYGTVRGAQGGGHFVAPVHPNSGQELLCGVEQENIFRRHILRRGHQRNGAGNHAVIPRMRAMLPPSTKARSFASGMALAIFMRSKSKSDPGHSLPMRIFWGPKRA